MKYAIDRLDRLLTEIVPPAQFSRAAITDQQVEDFATQVRQEQQLIRHFLWNKASKMAGTGTMAPLIALCQSSLTRLLDTLYGYLRKTARQPALHHCYKTLYSELDALMDYLERHFPQHLDGEQPLPAGYAVMLKRRLGRKATTVKKLLLSAGVHPTFTRLVLEGALYPLSAFTHNRYSYSRMLLAALADKELFKDATDPNQRLAEKLISLNYNYPPFVLEVIRYLHGEVEKINNNPARAQRLLFHLKTIKQIPLQSTLSCVSEHPSIGKQVSGWLKWELQFLEKHGSLQAPAAGAGVAPYIQTSLDGAHIYLLVMLTIDAGIILNHQYGSLAELVAPVIATRHKKGLSPESLKKYKDKISPQVRDDVKRVLRKMIELSDTI